jgi:hypothetical protein
MRVYSVHLPPGAAPASVPTTAPPTAAPVLLREGFAFWGFLFGPFWLLWHRCWLAGLGLFALSVALAMVPAPWDAPALLALHAMIGLHGQDLRRWTLARRGWRLEHVVAGADEEAAMLRLLVAVPRLAPLFAGSRG